MNRQKKMPNEKGAGSGGGVWGDLRRLVSDFASFSGSKGLVAVSFVGLAAIFEALSLAAIVPILTVATGADASGSIGHTTTVLFDSAGVQSANGRLAFLLVLFGILIIARAFALSVRDARVAELQVKFAEAYRLRIAEYLANAQWDQIMRLRHARITHLMSTDIQRLGDMTLLLLRSAVLGSMLLAQLILVLLLAPLFAALALVFLVFGVIAFLPFARRAHALGGFMTNANQALLLSTSQFLSGLKLAMSQNLQNRFLSEFRRSLDELTSRQIDYSAQQSQLRNALSIMSAFAAAILVFVGFVDFHLTTATLIAIVVIIARMTNPLGQIQQDIQQIAHFLPAYDRLTELAVEFRKLLPRSYEEEPTQEVPTGTITFDGVTYRYPSADGIEGTGGINDVSLTIRPGEMIGVTGPSGAGKTTFVDVLVGLCQPQTGQILVGHRALDDHLLPAWRDAIGYVAQEPLLFHDTVRNNFRWVSSKATDLEIWNALALTEAADLVRNMASGLDTIVGERGLLMSGGERQRIALAGAILRRPRVLILDEATNAIDIPTERKVLRKLYDIRDRPTIVMIAHRVESLTMCNRVFHFDAGRVVSEVKANSQSAPLGARTRAT